RPEFALSLPLAAGTAVLLPPDVLQHAGAARREALDPCCPLPRLRPDRHPELLPREVDQAAPVYPADGRGVRQRLPVPAQRQLLHPVLTESCAAQALSQLR